MLVTRVRLPPCAILFKAARIASAYKHETQTTKLTGTLHATNRQLPAGRIYTGNHVSVSIAPEITGPDQWVMCHVSCVRC